MNQARTSPGVPKLVIAALAIAAGMSLGRLPVPWWCWPVVATMAGGLLVWRPDRHVAWRLLPALVLLAAGWSGLHRQLLAPGDLMLASGHETPPVLVHLEGHVDSLAGIRMQLDVTRWLMPGGSVPVSGRVVVRLPGIPTGFLAGRLVRIKGWLNPIAAPRDGEPDWKSLALDGDYRGWLRLESMDLLEVLDEGSGTLVSWRGHLRSAVTRRVLAPPVSADGKVRSLLAALLLGQRDHEWRDVAPPFRRLGVAHLLAISGMHLGLLASMVLLLVRLGRGPRWWQGWIVLAVVVSYLSIVELRPPIVRAGIMTMLACVGLLNRRRLSGTGLLALAAIIVMAVQPGQVARPGFQLSFGVVAGLLLLASRVRRRWFGQRSWSASSPREVLGQWTRDALAASMTAWMISIPLVVGHFGQLAPLAVPMSLLLLPAVAALLAIGALRAVLGWLPGIGDLLGFLLVSCSTAVLGLVDGIDDLPWTSVETLQVGWPWVLCAMTWVVAWCGLQRRRNLLWPALVVLVGWILLEAGEPALAG